MKLVLEIFIDSLLAWNQLFIRLSSSFSIVWISFKDLPVVKILVSSAKRIQHSLSDTLLISFTYNRNNKGPKIDP
jgi:hypothetical protein